MNRSGFAYSILLCIIIQDRMPYYQRPWVERFQQWLMFDLYGPKVYLFRTQLAIFKGGTFIWVLFLMHAFQNYSFGMWLYLFLHGTYGICWVAKDWLFPDEKVLQPASIGSQCLLTFVLLAYWAIPVPLAAGYGITHPSPARVAFLAGMYIVGVIMMMGADYQKTTTLKKRRGLISDGFFKYTRNPNYLGEIMIYSSFVLCSGHVLGFIVLCGAGLLFALNISVKECSFQRKQGWEQYRHNSYILLPKLFPTLPLNIALYGTILLSAAYFLYQESPSTFLYPL